VRQIGDIHLDYIHCFSPDIRWGHPRLCDDTWYTSVNRAITDAFRKEQIKAYQGMYNKELAPLEIIEGLRSFTMCVAYYMDAQEKKQVLNKGYSFCSINDNYDRKKGNLIARGRALACDNCQNFLT